MPIQECTLDGKDGFRWGSSGKCYTHDGSEASRKAAKQKAVKQAIAAGASPREFEDALETVDIPGVEIMRTGTGIHGQGSPPEGDTYTADDLRAMATAAQELAAEGFKPPGKIGHEKTAPRVGWLDNIRTSDDGESLLTDLREVPKKFASAVKAGLWRARSPELYEIKSQKTGKKHRPVIGALAWLGARRPAIHALSDLDEAVLSLFEGKAKLLRAYEFDNPDPPDTEELLRAFVDLSQDVAEMKRAAADSGPGMSEVTLTEEQRGAVAEKLGVKPEELTPEKLLEGVEELKAKAEEPAPDDSDPDEPKPDDKPDEATKQLEARVEKTEKELRETREQLDTERKLHAVEAVIKSGREQPGRREKVETLYDKLGQELFLKHYEDVQPDPVWSREYGSDEDGDPESEEAKELLAAYEADASRRLGIKKEELV